MQVRYEPRSDHLLAIVSGPFVAARARAVLGDILRECQARSATKLLVDARGVSPGVSVADRYDLATQIAEYGAGRVRIAVLVAPENMFTKTLEDTATNRGAAVRTTASLEEALAYLDVAA